MLPFSYESLFSFVGNYNLDVWPAAVAALLLGLAVLYSTMRPYPPGQRISSAIVAAAWLWVGVIYYMDHLALLYFAAPYYGWIFVLQAGFLGWSGTIHNRFSIVPPGEAVTRTGIFLMTYGLFIYPLVDLTVATGWPDIRLFGVTPEPTLLFTIGYLITLRPRGLYHLFVLPMVACLAVIYAAWVLGIVQDLVVAIAAAIAVLAVFRNRE